MYIYSFLCFCTGGGQGTEGILAYAIDIDKFIYLLIQWRVPQFGVTESISFDCKVSTAISQGTVVPRCLDKRIRAKRTYSIHWALYLSCAPFNYF